MAKPRAQQALTVFFWSALFALAFGLNFVTPPWGDDWWRAEPPSHFWHIFTRIGDEYMGWTGRCSTLFLTFLVMLRYPGAEWIFDALNAVAWMAAVWVLFRCATGRRPRATAADTLTLFFAFSALFLLPQSLGEAALWTTGAVAYLWPIVAACWLFTDLAESSTTRDWQQPAPPSRIALLGHFAGAALIANTLENLGASFAALSIFLLAAQHLKKQSINRLHIAQSAGFVVGFLALAAAPGNYKRFAVQDDGQAIWVRFPDLLQRIWQVEWNETHAFAILAALGIAVSLLRPRGTRAHLALWLALAMMLAISMIGSTGVTYGQRTAFVAEFVLLIVIVGLAHSLLETSTAKPRHWAWLLPGAGLVGLLLFSSVTTLAVQSHAIHQQHSERLDLMRAYEAMGLRRILLPSIQVPYRRIVSDDIVDGPLFLRDVHGDMPGNAWRNSTYATYYGFEFATRLPQTALLFLPQLERPEWGYRKRAESGQHSMWTRTLGDRLRVDVLTPGGVCSSTILEYADNGSKQEVRWSRETQLAVVGATGNDQTLAHCSLRADIPLNAQNLAVRRDGRIVLSEKTGS